MLVYQRHREPRAGRALFGLVIAALLSIGLVAPVLAAPPKLSDPSVSPTSGTTSTKIVFEVSYDRPFFPERIVVVVGGTPHAMSWTGSGEWPGKGRFRWAGRLPAGKHAVRFEGSGVRDLKYSGAVTIVEPTPKPTPKPTAKPTPKPTAKPTAKPTSAPTPKPSAKPAAPPSPAPTAVSTADPTPGRTTATPTAPPGAGASPAVGGPGPSNPASPSADPETAGLPGGPLAPVPPGGGAGGGGATGGPSPKGAAGGNGGALPGGPEAALISALGLDGFGLPRMGLVPTLITTSGVATMAMAFGLFGKRRRDEEPPDDPSLGERTGSGVGLGGPRVAVAVAPIDAEMDMPRWRRPSLLQARKADPIRDVVEVPRLSFDSGLVGPIEGRERRLIRYDVVTLLDQPDELRGNHIGYLAQGDEVQLLEKHGVYWLVLCPDGSQGWVHRTTLGEPVTDDRRPDGARATMPTAADSWTLAENDIDSDVLAAYLEARRRA